MPLFCVSNYFRVHMCVSLTSLLVVATRYDFLLRRRDVGRPSESSVNTVLLLEKLPSRCLPSCSPNMLMSMKSSPKSRGETNREYRACCLSYKLLFTESYYLKNIFYIEITLYLAILCYTLRILFLTFHYNIIDLIYDLIY